MWCAAVAATAVIFGFGGWSIGAAHSAELALDAIGTSQLYRTTLERCIAVEERSMVFIRQYDEHLHTMLAARNRLWRAQEVQP